MITRRPQTVNDVGWAFSPPERCWDEGGGLKPTLRIRAGGPGVVDLMNRPS